METKRSIVILYRDLCGDWAELLERSHMNTLGMHFIPDRFEMEGYLDWLTTEGREPLRAIEEKGIAVEHELHALRYLLPRALFDTHPEYFRVNKAGERTPKHNACVSNADGLAVVAARACDLARSLGQKGHRYYLWSDDAKDAWCHCEQCREISPSDQNLLFLSAVLRGLRQYDPQAELCYLAYHEMLTPPTLPIPDGMFLEFAPIDRDPLLPLTAEENRPTREAIERLLTVFPAERAEVLDYWLDVSWYCRWGKLPIQRVPCRPEVWEADFAYYASLGIRSIKTFGAFMDQSYLETYGDEEIVRYGALLHERLPG